MLAQETLNCNPNGCESRFGEPLDRRPRLPERVWEVLTDGDLLGECLGGLATIDARPGGEVTFVDEHAARVGAIDQIVEEARLSFIWYADERDPSEVVIDLDPSETGTTVRVTERKFTWEFHSAISLGTAMGSSTAPVRAMAGLRS